MSITKTLLAISSWFISSTETMIYELLGTSGITGFKKMLQYLM